MLSADGSAGADAHEHADANLSGWPRGGRRDGRVRPSVDGGRERAGTIIQAAEEVIGGTLDEHFPLVIW